MNKHVSYEKEGRFRLYEKWLWEGMFQIWKKYYEQIVLLSET